MERRQVAGGFLQTQASDVSGRELKGGEEFLLARCLALISEGEEDADSTGPLSARGREGGVPLR
jgi:hypothetical protein